MLRFSLVPTLSGGMSRNFVSNRKTEEQCEKVTLKCKEGYGGVVLISFHVQGRGHQQRAVLHSMGRLGSELSTAVRALVSGLKYPPAEGARKTLSAQRQRGKPYSTGLLGFFLHLKGKRKLCHTLLPEDGSATGWSSAAGVQWRWAPRAGN